MFVCIYCIYVHTTWDVWIRHSAEGEFYRLVIPFVFLIIRLVPENVVMVFIDMVLRENMNVLIFQFTLL